MTIRKILWSVGQVLAVAVLFALYGILADFVFSESRSDAIARYGAIPKTVEHCEAINYTKREGKPYCARFGTIAQNPAGFAGAAALLAFVVGFLIYSGKNNRGFVSVRDKVVAEAEPVVDSFKIAYGRYVTSGEAGMEVRIAKSYVARPMIIIITCTTLFFATILWFGLQTNGGIDQTMAIVFGVGYLLPMGICIERCYRGILQAIYLCPRKLVFNFILETQTFKFDSPKDWTLEERKARWLIVSNKDGSSKGIPKNAFPFLGQAMRGFYGVESKASLFLE